MAAGVATVEPTGPTISIDPPPDVIVTVDVPETFQFSVVEPPRAITFGEASKVLITGNPDAGGAPPTLTDVIADLLPAELNAVIV